MRILIIYHNCLRDYRGALLLAEVLRYQGHKVWIRAHWRDEIEYAKLKNVDIIIVGQIAESSTYKIAEFAKQNNIRLAINASETAVTKDNYECLVVYNNKYLNEEMIDLQNLVSADIEEFIRTTPILKNTKKYVYLGMPRFDLSINKDLRNVEKTEFAKKYNLDRYSKVFLYISGFLFENTFAGVTEEDAEVMGLADHVTKQKVKLANFELFMQEFIPYLREQNAVLLIKRHPWDCSEFFEKEYGGANIVAIDRNEYIIPAIINSDIVIHEYSSTAIEGWLLNKPTYSIMLNEEYYYEYNHLDHEPTFKSFSEFVQLLNNDIDWQQRIRNSLSLFEPNIDGKATIRYANAINSIVPSANKSRFSFPLKKRLKTWIKDIFEERGYYKLSPGSLPVYSKAWDFTNWENDRARVRKLYKKAIRKYIQNNKRFIKRQ